MNKALSLLNKLIGAKKSALNTYKNTRKAYTKTIQELPKGHNAKKGGESMSKDLFHKGIKERLKNHGEAGRIAADATASHVHAGPKSLRRMKKQRKNMVTGRLRFARVGGKVIPIRINK